MPYFVYQVRPFGQLDQQAVFEAFPAASQHAKTLRGQLEASARARIKVIFAQDAIEAEDLLCQVRSPGVEGDD